MSSTSLEVGREFETYEEAHEFYQEHARRTGFKASTQHTRRSTSKTCNDVNDAVIVCSKFGTKRGSGPKSSAKTNCPAFFHVKRRTTDGRYYIHKCEDSHNHKLNPAQALVDQYASHLARQYEENRRQHEASKTVRGQYEEINRATSGSSSGQVLSQVLDAEESKYLLEFFSEMKSKNSNFFYAVETNHEQKVKSFFWADAKSRQDCPSFSDVVSVDTTFIPRENKIPLVLFGGVNQHYQYTPLGCALLSDETPATYSWVMRTWLKAMGNRAPKIILTGQETVLKTLIPEIFPSSSQYFCLWQVMEKVAKRFEHESFVRKFEKYVQRSWTEEEFEMRWLKLVTRFELIEDELMQSLFEDRAKWVPLFMGTDAFFAGLSSESVLITGYLDKLLRQTTTVQEFIKRYEDTLQLRFEEEGNADLECYNQKPAFRSPSPFEKQLAGIYTPNVLKRFQAEVVGTVACIPKRERQDQEMNITFNIVDIEKNHQEFAVTVNELKSEVSCKCRLFEYSGHLCRHAMIALQMCGISTIPSQYILTRFSRDLKKKKYSVPGMMNSENLLSRAERYSELCRRAMRLSEEGSSSQEAYNIAFSAFGSALNNCFSLKNSDKNPVEKANKAATKTKKRKTNTERSAQLNKDPMNKAARD